MNKFRSRLMSGAPLRDPLLRQKEVREPGETSDSLDRVVIPREEVRRVDHRDDDRHRLSSEMATACWNGEWHEVALVNLSGGGAMISASFRPQLWDLVELQLGDCGVLEAAVRWLRDDRIGLEFAHETRIDVDPAVRDELLRGVLARSFPDVAITLGEREPPLPKASEFESVQPVDEDSRRATLRHPMIWTGHVHYNHDSHPVRLRNISASGAMIEGAGSLPVEAELLLDLGEAGTPFAIVHWSHGDQAGLRFKDGFDVSALVRTRPQVASALWAQPEYRQESAVGSPWADEWGRLSLSDLKAELEGYLKR
ncbi:PilZ domain-containing protein [Sphingomonas sp. GCM10030256]|uniref:PilZ domain-containing protein n=1 Tax=Sphingomonas sp. GCM10030256 TaxID=3273427 RepID=UPI00362291D4